MSVTGFIVLGLLIIGVIMLGGAIGYLADRSPGYVMAAYDGMTVETSLWFAVAALFVGYILVRLLEYIITRLLSSRGRIGRWNRGRRTRNAAARTAQGLLLMAEGEWSEARRALVTAAPNAHSPLMNYLTAARAASNLGDKAHRDELLDHALESTPGSKLAVGLARVEMQQAAGEYESSLTQLEELRDHSPRHPVVQRLYVNAMERTNRLADLAPSLTKIKKSRALAKDEFASLENRVAAAVVGGAQDPAALQQAYSKLAKIQRTAPAVAMATAERALTLAANNPQGHEQAMEVAAKALGSAIDAHATSDSVDTDALFDLYGRLQGELKTRANLVQRWLKKKPQHAGILVAAARIAVAEGELEAAKGHLATALELQPGAAAYLEMAHLYCAEGDAQQALQHLEQAQPQMTQLFVAAAAQAAATDAAAGNEATDEASAA